MTYPEHHDLSGLEVPDRSGDVLLVGDLALVGMVARVAYNAWRLMGSTHSAAPVARALSHRVLRPQPGDPVYVPDSFRRDEGAQRKGIGYLVVSRTEWSHTEQEWAEHGARTWAGAPRPREDVFYLQYGPQPDAVCRWQNAHCNAIPYGEDMMRQVDVLAGRVARGERLPG